MQTDVLQVFQAGGDETFDEGEPSPLLWTCHSILTFVLSMPETNIITVSLLLRVTEGIGRLNSLLAACRSSVLQRAFFDWTAVAEKVKHESALEEAHKTNVSFTEEMNDKESLVERERSEYQEQVHPSQK